MSPFKISIQNVVLLVGAVVVGAVFSYYLRGVLVKPYEPVGAVSIGIVQDVIPGKVGNSVYEGTAVHYNSQICLNNETPVDAIVTIKWRQFEPVINTIIDPAYEKFPLRLQPGCERTIQASLNLPDFVTPGIWSIEADIKVTKGENHAQITKFATTRFNVIKACEGCPPSQVPSLVVNNQ